MAMVHVKSVIMKMVSLSMKLTKRRVERCRLAPDRQGDSRGLALGLRPTTQTTTQSRERKRNESAGGDVGTRNLSKAVLKPLRRKCTAKGFSYPNQLMVEMMKKPSDMDLIPMNIGRSVRRPKGS